MKAKEIQDLINFISESGLDEVSIETNDFKVHVKKSAIGQVVPVAAAPAQVVSAPPAQVEAPKPSTSDEKEASAGSSDANHVVIKSPMIGTFYRSSNPDSDAFVKPGDTVSQGDAVCIIEAMKLFNEIESDVSGTIVKVLVDNSTPVEFDQPLFIVDPS